MPEMLLEHVTTGNLVNKHEVLVNGAVFQGTYNADSPAQEKYVYGSGVQKTPGFTVLRKKGRMKYGPQYHKFGWTESLGQAVQRSYSHVTKRMGSEPYSDDTYEEIFMGASPSLMPNFPSPELQSCQEEADRKSISKLLDQLKGDGANLANFLAERKQTADLVSSTLHRLGNTALALRRRDLRSAARYLFGDARRLRNLRAKDISRLWLEIQYGWKPLLNDVYDVVNKAHETESSRIYRLQSRATVTRGSDGSSMSWAWHNSKRVGFQSSSAASTYTIRATPDGILKAPAAFGFTNPAAVAWELVPWSFVVDWFLPVGQWLEQLTASHGWTFLDGGSSRLLREGRGYSWDVRSSSSSFAPGDLIATWTDSSSSDTASGTSTWWRFERNPLGDFPWPKTPTFKNPFSLAHVENAVSLAYQAFGRDPEYQPRASRWAPAKFLGDEHSGFTTFQPRQRRVPIRL